MSPQNPLDFNRFWDKVSIESEDSCWPWTAGLSSGYGSFKFSGRSICAHRVAYWLANDCPEDMPEVVRHTCDNPKCCNTNHLIGGTHADNVMDRVSRGRSATGERHRGGRRKKQQCLLASAKPSKPCKIAKPEKPKNERSRGSLPSKRRQKLIDMGLLES